MSIFKRIEKERREFIPLKNIIEEIAYIESITPNEVAASLYREMVVPFHDLNLYYYDMKEGFVKLKHHEELSILQCITDNWDCPLPKNLHQMVQDIATEGYPTFQEYSALWKTGVISVIRNVGNNDFEDYNVGVNASEFYSFLKSIKGPIPPSIFNLNLEVAKMIVTTDFEIPKEIEKNLVVREEITEWKQFYGKDTALMLIAGMSVALEQAGGKYLRGNRINKSAVAEAAKKAINDFGCGTELTNKTLTDLIKLALDQHLPKMED